MKILIHSLNYAPEVTGIGKYNAEMGEWLAERGHEVRVVTAPPYYPMWEVGEGYSNRTYRHEQVAGTDVWRCPLFVPKRPSGAKRLVHLASFAASSFPVMLRQVSWRPDVVMVTGPPLLCVPQARLVARLCGAKTWLHILDFEVDAALRLGMLRGSILPRLLRRVEHFMMRGIDKVSSISDKMCQRLVKKGIPEDRVYLFPNWADPQFVRPVQRDEKVRREFGARPNDVLVLHAGSMGEKLGLEQVLNAAERLRGRAEVKFALVGAGAMCKRLQREAEKRKLDNLRFFPLQPSKRLPLMLAAGDIHLVVQRREAADLVMPSKLTNILAAGRASIATVEQDTAVYNVLNGYDCGVTIPPESAAELTASIAALADDAELRESLGRNARNYAEAFLQRDRILSAFEAELQQLGKARQEDDLLPENWSSYYESPAAHNGHAHNGHKEGDSLWANDTHRSRSSASSAKRRQA
jgi:colanic acid biosynthesis glycosyl transferase WcaI